MANQVLADTALPIGPEAIFHDWWLSLVASGLGRIKHVGVPMLKYRQHGTNVLGADGYSPFYFFSRLGGFARTDLLRRIVAQAVAFHSIYESKLSPEDRISPGAFPQYSTTGYLSDLWSFSGMKEKPTI